MKTNRYTIFYLTNGILMNYMIFYLLNRSKKLEFSFGRNVDIKIIDKFGPDGISNLIKIFSNKAVKFQSGYVYQYAFIMLLGFSALLTYLIII